MADDGSSYGGDNYLDPRGDTPVGSTWGTGGIGANDPLVDWASNLKQDDLARFIHDPDGHAQNMAAAGIPPPDPAALHAANGRAGTPTDPFRFDQSAEGGSPFNPSTYMGNMQQQAPPQGKRGLRMEASDIGYPQGGTGELAPEARPGPSGPQSPADLAHGTGTAAAATVGTLREGLNKAGEKIRQGVEALPKPDVARERLGGLPAGTTPADAPGSPPPGVTVTKPVPVPVPVQPQTPAVTQPKTAAPAAPTVGPHPLDPAEETDQAAPADKGAAKGKETPKEKSRMEAVGDAISDLGKAMQGVKGPEPLKPPSSFAPAPHQAAAQRADVPSILAALASARGGQVPPSAMPILRVLGRA